MSNFTVINFHKIICFTGEVWAALNSLRSRVGVPGAYEIKDVLGREFAASSRFLLGRYSLSQLLQERYREDFLYLWMHFWIS